jgi:hypothetical protein
VLLCQNIVMIALNLQEGLIRKHFVARPNIFRFSGAGPNFGAGHNNNAVGRSVEGAQRQNQTSARNKIALAVAVAAVRPDCGA